MSADVGTPRRLLKKISLFYTGEKVKLQDINNGEIKECILFWFV
jgi:hypothetical protein